MKSLRHELEIYILFLTKGQAKIEYVCLSSDCGSGYQSDF